MKKAGNLAYGLLIRAMGLIKVMPKGIETNGCYSEELQMKARLKYIFSVTFDLNQINLKKLCY